MEKYAVEIEHESSKLANDTTRCKNCLDKLESNSNVPKCPKCGTEFTEKQK